MRGLVVVLWPGEVPRVEELDLHADSTARVFRSLLGKPRIVETVRWGLGLMVAADEDAAEKGFPRSATLQRVDDTGKRVGFSHLVGPVLVYAHDERGVPRGLSAEETEDIVLALRMGQTGQEAACPWKPSSLN